MNGCRWMTYHLTVHTIIMPMNKITVSGELQALVYDILPSNTAVFSYAIGSIKLSANEQFFLLMLK